MSKIAWNHPLTILVISTLIAAGGWAAQALVFNRGGIRVDLDDTAQDISLATNAVPHIGAERLYCDTLKTTLVINYSDFGTRPVAITRIAFNVKPVSAANPLTCSIDPLSAQPKGISIRDSYIFTIRNIGNIGKYIKSGNVGDASDVSLDNILETHQGTQTISVIQNEQPIVRDVYISSLASTPSKVWFTVYYDSDGERQVSTLPLFIVSSD